jgi:hypothetical protein
MRVELDGVFYSLPDNDEAASLMSELRAHDTSMNVLKYLLNAAGNREMDLWDRIKTMSLEYKKTVT